MPYLRQLSRINFLGNRKVSVSTSTTSPIQQKKTLHGRTCSCEADSCLRGIGLRPLSYEDLSSEIKEFLCATKQKITGTPK